MIKTEATVIRSTGSWYELLTAEKEIISARLRGKFKTQGIKSTNPVVVGDHVIVEGIDEEYVITKIKPRSNYIVRKATNLSKRSHIIASNIDQAILICTLKSPRTSLGFIDRFLVTAEAYHIPAILIFNKIDLYEEKDLVLMNSYIALYQKIGYQCIITSTKSKIGIEELKELSRDKVNLFSGHSGVGKSSIINLLDPNLSIKTGDISDYHLKGKHTTTFAEMHQLDYGGFIVDTPGIKEFGLIDFEKVEIGHNFPEIRNLMDQCRYANCLHEKEPGCAVKIALENDEIEKSRYQNYLNMIHSHDETHTSF